MIGNLNPIDDKICLPGCTRTLEILSYHWQHRSQLILCGRRRPFSPHPRQLRKVVGPFTGGAVNATASFSMNSNARPRRTLDEYTVQLP